MRIDGVPTEEVLRELLAEARGSGAERIVVETSHEAGDAWIRAGFTESARILEAPVELVERQLVGAKEPSFGSVHVQTDDLEAVVRAVRQFVPRLPGGSQGSIVSPPRNGWIAVYDELCDREPEMLRRLARELSDRMGAVLLLHGFPLDARMWEAQRGRLEQAGYEVIAPNLPGREPENDIARWSERIL